MQQHEAKPFQALLTQVMALYRQDVTPFLVDVWWQACSPFEFDAIRKAMTAHATDPDRGQWSPKPADIVRLLAGTQADRSLMAWGKVYDAMRHVGAYGSVAFDDPAIAPAIVDIGGWVAICRSDADELPHLQRRFCASHAAYTRSPPVQAIGYLMGEHEAINSTRGHRSKPPTLIGDASKAAELAKLGPAAQKVAITHAVEALRLQ